MDKTVNKIITCEVKEVAPRTLEFTGSDETVDRSGDIVRASGWQLDNYVKNPVFLWAHDYHSPPIGKAVKVWTEGTALKFHIQFPTKEEYPFADTIHSLYKGGYLKAVSVGFRPLDGKDMKEGGTEFLKQELFELSGCPVPANPSALISAREAGLITVKEFNSWKPTEWPELLETDEMKDKRLQADKQKTITQSDIADEIDYLELMIKEAGLNSETKKLFMNLFQAVDDMELIDLPAMVKRISGPDTPVIIKQPEPVPPTPEQIKEAIRREIEPLFKDALRKVQGKI